MYGLIKNDMMFYMYSHCIEVNSTCSQKCHCCPSLISPQLTFEQKNLLKH